MSERGEHIDVLRVPPSRSPLDTQQIREIEYAQECLAAIDKKNHETQPMKTLKKIKFLPDIDLGNVLQIIALVCAAFGVYVALDKRVTVVEESQKFQVLRDAQQDERAKESNEQVREVLKEIKEGIKELNNRDNSRGQR